MKMMTLVMAVLGMSANAQTIELENFTCEAKMEIGGVNARRTATVKVSVTDREELRSGARTGAAQVRASLIDPTYDLTNESPESKYETKVISIGKQFYAETNYSGKKNWSADIRRMGGEPSKILSVRVHSFVPQPIQVTGMTILEYLNQYNEVVLRAISAVDANGMWKACSRVSE